MIKLFLFDIEGTTTDINFVHKVLFPYSDQNMEQFVLHHQTELQTVIENVRRTVADEEKKQIGLHEAIAKLKQWIKEDRKHPALKEIQGLIWNSGYVNNHFKGHVYPDVAPYFKKLVTEGAKIGIYSSGSVHAQKLIFGYSEAGDLTPFISFYFDTKVGAKRDKNSYITIAKETGFLPEEIRFFSDIPQELEAAELAGVKVTHVLRAGTLRSNFDGVFTFK